MIAELVPPQAPDSEMIVLGSLLLEPSEFRRVEGWLRPEHFFRLTHGDIYATLLDLWHAQGAYDLFIVGKALERCPRRDEIGGVSYLASLLEYVPTAATLPHHARLVVEKALRRDLMGRCQETAHLAVTDEQSFNALLAGVGEWTADLQGQMLPDGQIIEARVAVKEWADQSTAPGIRTGLPRFDELTNGLEPGDFVVIAGRPTTGKTSLACVIARTVAGWDRRPVLFVSKEMSRAGLTLKFISLLSDMNSTALRHQESRGHPKVESAQHEFASWPLFFEDSPIANIDQIVPLVHRAHARHGLALVILDYLTLLEGKGHTRTQEIGSVSRGLKRLAKECGLPVLVLAQLNRAVESRPSPRPHLSDLRDSGEVEQDADKIAFLWRHEGEPGQFVHKLSLEKNRLGPTGTITLFVDFKIGLIGEAEETPR